MAPKHILKKYNFNKIRDKYITRHNEKNVISKKMPRDRIKHFNY